jgi:hypothetical protein
MGAGAGAGGDVGSVGDAADVGLSGLRVSGAAGVGAAAAGWSAVETVTLMSEGREVFCDVVVLQAAVASNSSACASAVGLRSTGGKDTTRVTPWATPRVTPQPWGSRRWGPDIRIR